MWLVWSNVIRGPSDNENELNHPKENSAANADFFPIYVTWSQTMFIPDRFEMMDMYYPRY